MEPLQSLSSNPLLAYSPWSEGVPPAGFEPATGGLEVRCSIRLSYRGSVTIVPDEAVPFRVHRLGLLRGLRAPMAAVAAGLALTASAGCSRGPNPAVTSDAGSPSAGAVPDGGSDQGPAATYALPDLAPMTTVPVPATVVPPPTAPPDDLAAVTAITPLDGFTEIAGGPGLGALDLASASDGDARERDALNRFRFRDGFARGFAKDAEEMIVTVLRFSSPADAEAYLKDTVESSLVSNGSFLFAVPVPGGTGYREQGAGEDGQPYVTYGALFSRGDRVFEQLVRSPATGPERSEADAQLMARRQADRVGG